ncbi:hypothetical protein ACEQ8H_000054 [Pleosporales sp. CAS-2024a]
MLGIHYESSDEEDAAPASRPDAPAPEAFSQPTPLEQPAALSPPISGPWQGPTVSPPPQDGHVADSLPPGSPYTSNRALIHSLTLPTVPNFNIAPSPPGSPPQKASTKFAQFLDLKGKDQHFNQRLEASSVLRDAGHLRKLLDFAGISEEEQYASALPEDLALPTVFPDWAYAEELKASQKQIWKTREQHKSKRPREAVEFVSATSSASSSRAATPSGRIPHRSTKERA